MAHGIAQKKIDEMMEEVASMGQGELKDFNEDAQEKTNDLSEGHLDSYLDECVRESREADKDRRSKDQRLWQAHESDLADLAEKEAWQSKIVLNKPFTTVIQAKSLVRRGLIDRPEYFGLTVNDDDSQEAKLKAKFWDKSLKYWTGKRDSYVPYVFADAAEMGFAVGESMAIKILWEPDDNEVYRLKLISVPPWRMFHDPDREPRKPWSGLYGIHEEWVDMHILRQKEAMGYLQNIDQVRTGRNITESAGHMYGMFDPEEERKKKGQTLTRNKFRKSVLVREFWGSILDENGEIVMPNARYSVANGVVIAPPRPNPYARMKWPWVSFSPIPHLLRFHGYGIYESVLSIWKFQNALLNLYIDNENWRVNNMFEFWPNEFQDPTDEEAYPGKLWKRKMGASKDPAIRPVLKGESNLADFRTLWGVAGTEWENGSFVNELVKGEIGGRKNITAREIEIKTKQSIGVFDSIGRDVEQGGTDLLWAIKEVLTTFWDEFDRPSYTDIFGQDDELHQMMSQLGMMDPQARMKAMELDCEVRVEGVSRLFDRDDVINKLKEMAALAESEVFTEFMEREKIARGLAKEINQQDMVKSEEKMKQETAQQENAALRGGVDEAVSAALTVADQSANPSQQQNQTRRQ